MTLTGSRSLTVHDLAAIPDDGRRHELVDGMRHVSPAPGLAHQTAVFRLYGLLESGCPPGTAVVGGSFAVRSGDRVELRPDVTVGRAEEFTEAAQPAVSLLVLSESSAVHDLVTKEAVLRADGSAELWGGRSGRAVVDGVRTGRGSRPAGRRGRGRAGSRTAASIPGPTVPEVLIGRI